MLLFVAARRRSPFLAIVHKLCGHSLSLCVCIAVYTVCLSLLSSVGRELSRVCERERRSSVRSTEAAVAATRGAEAGRKRRGEDEEEEEGGDSGLMPLCHSIRKLSSCM